MLILRSRSATTRSMLPVNSSAPAMSTITMPTVNTADEISFTIPGPAQSPRVAETEEATIAAIAMYAPASMPRVNVRRIGISAFTTP